jgi:predicted dehydrogenase
MYASVLRDCDDVRLLTAYDDDAERGRSICDKVGMPYTPHVEDVLDNPDVQAVIVGVETNRHAELCVAAAEAGKHVLCQKPMALSLEDCDRMIAARDKAGIHFTMAFQMRHDPDNIKMREVVRAGELGRIAVARRRHCIPMLLNSDFVTGPTRWHVDPVKNKGMFMDDATHPADWFHWMFGKPVSVIAEIDNVITDVAPDDNGVAVYRFQQGEMGILFNSSTVKAGENTTEIYGEHGCLIQNYGDGPSNSAPRCPDGPALKIFRHDAGDWDIPDLPVTRDHGNRIRAVARPWIDSLLNDTPPTATAEDGRVAVEMILGAYTAAREGRRVIFE